MEENYREAFYEVSCILKLMPKFLTDKIPNNFKEVIEENKSIFYTKEITEPLRNEDLKLETIIILGMIYKEFLHDKIPKEILEQVNTNSCEVRNSENNFEELALVEVKKEKWYKKIIELFTKKNRSS